MKKNYMKIVVILWGILIYNAMSVYGLDIDYICGSDRYETAAKIASKISYSSAILVNGDSLADGLSASGLSGAVNAPILLTRTDSIPQNTVNKLDQVRIVYIVGGTGVISKDIESKIISMGKRVIRLGGNLRYDTSILVANEIERVKGIQELYYVNGVNGEADAMSIAPVAASKGNPVVLTDGISTTYKRNVQSYTIGGTGVMNLYFDGFAERIYGSDRFETNKNVINKFFSDKTHIYLSKSHVLVDALTASALKEPVVLISDDSDKSVIAGAKSATVLGNITQTSVNRAKSYLFGDKVIFYIQHQDDETIFAGSTIVDAIQSVGSENVHIVLVTDGNESGVFNDERYENFTYEEKVTLRNNEFRAAIVRLGVDMQNVVFLNQPESEVNTEVLKGTILYFENSFNNVTHITHSYKCELHEQHIATGKLINQLKKDGFIKECRFFARPDKISQIPHSELIESVADNEKERQAVLNACNEYELDNKDMIREGIGYKSVRSLFRALTSNPKASSYLHESGI